MDNTELTDDSSIIEVREAKPDDAAQLNAHIRLMYAEGEHLITKPREFRIGVFRQRFWIAKRQSDPLQTCLVAYSGKTLVGMLESWTDKRARIRHVTTFAMSVNPEWQRQGIGKKLLEHFIEWVAQHKTLEKIELHVHSDNEAAKALYKQVGFEEEGRRRKAVRYENKGFVDDILMAYWPNSSNVE